jgi:hypothetical protein
MPKESTIQLYNSSVTGNSPSSGDLSLGELAINTSDEKVFLKNLGGTVLSLSQTKDLSGAFANRSQVASSVYGITGDVLLVAGTNVSLTSSGKTITISAVGLSAAASDFVTQGKLDSDFGVTGQVDNTVPFVDDFDPQGWWNATTQQFKPTVSGYYDVSYGAWLSAGTTSVGQANIQIRKNGSTFLISQSPLVTSSDFTLEGTKSVFLNGSTDYVDFTVYTSQTPSQTLKYGGTSFGTGTWFRAFLLSNNTPPTAYVSSLNGATGAVQVTGSGAITQTVSGTTTTLGARLATTSVTGVASFNANDFSVATTGHISLTGTVARTNTTQTFTGLQRFSNGISAAGATFDAGSTVRLSTLASHPQVDIGGGFYSGGNISGEAVNNVYFVAGQGGSGDFPTKPYISFNNNSTDLGADITFQALGGDIKFTANTDIDIVASNGNVNISSASGGIVIDPVTFVNIAGGVLYVDDTNNRVGINDTTPSMALCVNGGISGNSMIIAAGATFNSRANFAAGLTTANLFVTSGATFGTTINAPNIVSKWSVITADQTAEVNNGYLTNKGTLLVLTLPTTAAVGSMIRVSGMNAGLWKIAQNASQVIHFGKTDTTTGTGGYISSTLARDSVELVCCVANNEWNVVSAVGNITIA